MRMLVRVVLQAVAIWVATLLLPGLEVVGGDSTGARILVFLAVAVVFGLALGTVLGALLAWGLIGRVHFVG